MSIRNRLSWRLFFRFLVWWIFFSCFPGLISSAEVTLDSIEIFNTHEWLLSPTVYFACKGENETVLPDVTKKDVVYSFKGEESWQPLTELESKKCKRCGFYEKDTFKPDDMFDEWEFCASDFNATGKYVLFKGKELNATFNCQDCKSIPAGATGSGFEMGDTRNKTRVAIIVLIVLAVLIVIIIAMVMAYKYWQKKKRQQDQARFLKLFEEGDDLEDELELSSSL